MKFIRDYETDLFTLLMFLLFFITCYFDNGYLSDYDIFSYTDIILVLFVSFIIMYFPSLMAIKKISLGYKYLVENKSLYKDFIGISKKILYLTFVVSLLKLIGYMYIGISNKEFLYSLNNALFMTILTLLILQILVILKAHETEGLAI